MEICEWKPSLGFVTMKMAATDCWCRWRRCLGPRLSPLKIWRSSTFRVWRRRHHPWQPSPSSLSSSVDPHLKTPAAVDPRLICIWKAMWRHRVWCYRWITTVFLKTLDLVLHRLETAARVRLFPRVLVRLYMKMESQRWSVHEQKKQNDDLKVALVVACGDD